jgi:uncharacterized protein (TIGR02594 family)
MTREPLWLEIARSHIGEAAIAGPSANPYIVGLYALSGHPEIKTDEVAWCAAFCNGILNETGIPGTHSLAANSFMRLGEALDRPRVGALAVWPHHVAIVSQVHADGSFSAIGGNQGHAQGMSAVTEAKFKLGTPAQFRWPLPLAAPADMEAAGSRTAAKGKTDLITGWTTATLGVAGLTQGAPPAAPEVVKATSTTDQVAFLSQVMTLAKSLGDLIHSNPLAVIIMAVGSYLIASGALLRLWRTEDANNGRNLGR